MTKEEFVKAYIEFLDIALALEEKALREGLLSLEENLDEEKANARDIFHYGLRYVIDGTDTLIIEKILTNIVEQEKDEYLRKFKNIQKEAVIGIQLGFNPQIFYSLLNSYTDFAYKSEFNFDEDEAQYEHEEGKYDGEV